ncbi:MULTISPECIES: TlpA family protein disulfide reductase [Microbacterium]|uniref:Alkyl hydroperoxide reductase n=2 Tax=Microbacterium aurantiacum TaxID=162393 RepID=A0A0M8MFQ3_9MICO|nr:MULTISPECIES: TlpA disulfide reductase family protein [Microbacterium]ODT10753.1 MAG: alkyl hydroperoxide reductase [Microbacterium sp. SCN 70-18]ANG84100.1 alkyl hydroperoxide reductase [Microbacterium chocolatum]KOS10548.1 alkyl hydroperoxide reductase [Microbacterium chocolatum]MBN9200737.1 TlpA family protein disulfide reductase [Microbacterium chocolatum]MDS0245511.1 TlpA family protein disulfide reductase [Microbacterium aurantiacum]
MTTNRWRRAAASVLALTLAAGLAACTSDPLAEQYREGDNKGFIAADGFRVVEIPEAERTNPIEFEAVLDNGETATSADYAGDVLVVNFWYAACAPCRVEAPELAEVHESFRDDGVDFLGVNLYDGAEASQAFAETYGIEYPSALTTVDGSIKLAFAGETPLNAVPVTLVLDRDGRVAARLIGQISDASILETLVRDTRDEA